MQCMTQHPGYGGRRGQGDGPEEGRQWRTKSVNGGGGSGFLSVCVFVCVCVCVCVCV